MKNPLFRLTSFVFAALIIISSCLIEADAQNRRRRPRRTTRPVIVNPEIAPAAQDQNPNDEAKIISTADESATDPQQLGEETQTNKTTPKKAPSEQEQMQRTINSLSQQVERLSDKLGQMQENDKTLLEMERLTRAEQRAESLRSQLLDTETKLADLYTKLEQIDYSSKPENIERATAGYGSVRPEETRDARRRQLESEKTRTLAQIRILETSRIRLEASLVTADGEVDRLRRRLELRDQQEADSSSTEDRGTKNPERPQ